MNLIKLKKLFSHYAEIKLAYLFGSHAEGTAGPASDYDFAFYLNEKNEKKRFAIRLKLFVELSKIQKTDKIDVLILNDTDNSELKYNIIHDGKLLYSKEPYQIIVEPRIMNEFFDFRYTSRKYNLTKA
jgi:predicted nucleotidyltransferase